MRGLQWFATEDGIRIWDKKSKRLYLLTTAEGLPNNAVSSILEDRDGVVWASTLNGICKIIPREEEKGGYCFPWWHLVWRMDCKAECFMTMRH